jgi:hypothetical protein
MLTSSERWRIFVLVEFDDQETGSVDLQIAPIMGHNEMVPSAIQVLS